MSIDATKSITAISGLMSRDVISEQQKNQTAVIPAQNDTKVSANVNLSQNSVTLLRTIDNDINVKKVDKIKQAIADGSLVIDSRKIAKELIQQMLQNIES
ncbi:flagellar biosynthesis anti-sigma factor FlgM [Gilliamella sp. B2776]|uniref:flagellar biosynthesis anti-sigma factor FlgM n=1 Tax=unclassified Gilliamella TaxID=2685620 RepID=UPI00226AF683|nr:MULTISPECIES: flagellar biosynthesis anti-sigma factor FlgM [unclassified Gilliamella]MCX8650899.1 flagellar biosynthesis anti-sigma factor FlgM [Gilliamella sp. B2779]MCX8654118.1 flagellar biosynthesis anti-sigma factor FlgM [Gilliamella sp. B2737]MCX8657232.1 flagellar biosynthesis anti-sigma factor FlgM [Gilliamella sp. B2894]MCX8665845.1 flagellar biosynthesis anti-sigma factor FlgM [Gilliamella sp. B2887]MCX8692685.1 flagellar biosynthesis anti-sigma factor FlgM [Gilliamella sp. B2776